MHAEELTQAFETFTVATARLEHEYAALQERLARLTAELEASQERERRLEAEALRQSRLAAMGETAAMLAHEVRNPLGAMELFTGLLLQDLRDRPDAQRLAQQVARGIADLNHLVTNLLEFTRTRVPRRQPIDCCGLLDDALRYTVELHATSTVAVERHYAGAQVMARADADLLRPVLLNLVRNAMQAMPDGGRLTVGVSGNGAGVELSVRDTGPGIPQAEQETIFRPFFSKRTRGTGLGLSVARELVKGMGGGLRVESEVGHGATFTVTLPAA